MSKRCEKNGYLKRNFGAAIGVEELTEAEAPYHARDSDTVRCCLGVS